MSYKINKIKELDIIKVEYFGDVTLDHRMDIVTELCLNYIDRPTPKILIDARRLSTIMTMTEQVIWGKYIGSRHEIINALVAVIYDPKVEINQKAINEAIQVGHKVKQFISEEDAIAWLCGL